MSEHEPTDFQRNVVEFDHHSSGSSVGTHSGAQNSTPMFRSEQRAKPVTAKVSSISKQERVMTSATSSTYEIPGAKIGAYVMQSLARSALSVLPTTGGPKAASFKDHSHYQSIQKVRLLGSTFGVADPFFKAHESRLGATTLMNGVTLTNYGSYDYLGLNQAVSVGQAAKDAIDTYGTSVSASRIVAGERPLHAALEAAIADFYDAQASVCFVSGHATNVSTISTLMTPDDLILHDELVHNSAIVGAKLSGATCKAFAHNDMDGLERRFVELRSQYKNVLVVVEGLYSMDGDIPDLPRLVELKNRFGAWLMVDEAHSLGVLGKTGRGIAEHYDLAMHQVDIWMGTLSKTLGSCGGYIAGTQELIDILKYRAPGFVYSVGLPAPAAAAALAALELLKAEPERVAKLRANGKLFLEEAQKAGLDTGTSIGYAVVPVITGDMVKAVKLTERLIARGINAMPIIPPAVPMKASRVRFFITSEHTPEQIRETVKAIKEEIKVLSSFGGVFKKTVKA
jgi:8-amino-7-oxononanoate synthase